MPGAVVCGCLVLVVMATAGASDIGVVPYKLVVKERLFGRVTMSFEVRDAAVANGPALDVEKIGARLHVEYANRYAAGALVILPGAAGGWVRHDPVATMYRNRAVADGSRQMRTIVIRPGNRVKLRAVGVGVADTPLDILGAGPPTGSIYVSFELVEAGITTRFCSEVQNCVYRVNQRHTQATLTCRGGVADPDCRAAHPVYVSGQDVRYGGPGTVAIIGDSITNQARTALEEAFAEGWFVHVRATSGAMFCELQQASEAIGRSHPQVAVINLGTNDFGCNFVNVMTPETPCRYPEFDLDALRADARSMVASVAGACVLGTTTKFGHVVGMVWAEMMAEGGVAAVVPWREYLASLSEDERGLLITGMLGHLTVAGRVALAEMTAQVVDQACAGQ